MTESKVRNSQEIGDNLIKIVERLMANDDLVNLLYYTDKDPYARTTLTELQKQTYVFDNLIKIVPRMGPKDTAQSVIALRVVRGNKNLENGEFRDIQIAFEVFVPLTQWYIKDTNLRPFAILGEIEKSLDGKRINGLGKMTGGDFSLNFLTDEMSCYEQTFYITQYA